MKHKFSDLIDIAKLKDLMHSLYQATGIPSGIIDVNGDILVESGWQEICRNFHRQNPRTERLCRCSNAYIESLLHAKRYVYYTCPNGLIDAAAPIIIDGVHLATIFQGQFFFEKPDIDYFIRQAKCYGFNERDYLAALDKVPIYTPGKLDSIMQYFLCLVEMLADSGLTRLRNLKLKQQEGKKSDEKIFKIFNSTPNIAIQGYDVAGNITLWNDASEKMFGFKKEEITGKHFSEILDIKEAAKFRSILSTINITDENYGPAEWKLKDKDGNTKYTQATVFPLCLSTGGKQFICMDMDITEQKQLTKEIERLDRLNLIGEMAASIGHEVRNPMTTVRGYLQMMEKEACSDRHRQQFSVMIEELDRANQIITEYLSLAKNKSIERKPCDLNNIIGLIMPLLYADAIKENKIIHVLPGDITRLPLDEKEIRQLLINLVRNALEAIDRGGAIYISTFMDDEAVVLKVQDTGSGIPDEVLDKIGTPFFTTKASGTGLGLAVCFSIASRHNAKISFQSDSEGTTVSVKFTLP